MPSGSRSALVQPPWSLARNAAAAPAEPSPFRRSPALDGDQHAVGRAFEHEPDAVAGLGARDGRREQIVEQTFDARAVDHDRRGLDRDVEVALLGERELAHHAAHERVDLGAAALEHGFAAREPVRVEDVADRVLHPLGLRHQLVEQSLVVLAHLTGGQGSREPEDRRERTLRVDRQRVRDLRRGAGVHRRGLPLDGSAVVASFGGLLEARERSLGLEQARPGIGRLGLGLGGQRRHLLLELLVAPREPTRRRHRLLELVPQVRQLFLYGRDLRGVRVVGAHGVELGVHGRQLGRQVLGLGPGGLELGVLVVLRGGGLRGLRSLRHLVGADLGALGAGRELGDEPLRALGAVRELEQARVLFLDPSGQLRRPGFGGLGAGLGPADLRRELGALGVPRLDLRLELRGPDLRPFDLGLELGRSGLGPLHLGGKLGGLCRGLVRAALLLRRPGSTPATRRSRAPPCPNAAWRSGPRAPRPSRWRPAATSEPRRARCAPRRTAHRDPSGRSSPPRGRPSRPRARG